MPYIGNVPAEAYSQVSYQDLTGGSGTSFTLDYPVGSAGEIEVFVNNVRQEPTVAYTVNGTALTMTGSVAATDDFYVVFQGKAEKSGTIPEKQTDGTYVFPDDVTVNGNITSTGVDITGTLTSDGLTVTQTGSTTAKIGATGTSGDNDGTLIINNGGTGDGMLRFDYESNTDRARIGVSASNQNLQFFTAGNNERMHIGSNGDVAIGTTTPMVKLHVHDSTTARFALTNSSTGQTFPDGFELLATGLDAYVQNRSNGNMVFTTNNIERMRILAGGGITFNGDTAAANALDDYEEGTWTPAPTVGTASTVSGNYTKIGRLVHVTAYVGGFSNTTNNEVLIITGLPFTGGVNSAVSGNAMWQFVNIDFGYQIVYYDGSSQLRFYHTTNGGFDPIRHIDLDGSSTEVYFSATYAAT